MHSLFMLKCIFGLLVLAGEVKGTHMNFIDLCAQDGSGIQMYRLPMSYKRFSFLLRYLLFDNIPDRVKNLKIDNRQR